MQQKNRLWYYVRLPVVSLVLFSLVLTACVAPAAAPATGSTAAKPEATAAPVAAGAAASRADTLVFAADLNGSVFAFDQRDGSIRFRYNTGQPIGGGVVSYAVSGKQYIAVASGLDAPMTWQTKSSAATVIVFALP